MAKTHQIAWTAGAAAAMVAVAAAAVVVITTDHHREVDSSPPPPQVFHDVIPVAGLLDALPVVADLDSAARWPDDRRSVELEVRPPESDHGCDTMNIALAAELDDVTFVAGTDNCVVAQGVLNDPYTGATAEYDVATEKEVAATDYVYPLDAAWTLGAAAWTPEQQQRFVSDVHNNIIVASAPAVEDRAQRGLSRWHPDNSDFACAFAAKYLRVAQIYALPITRGDAAAARQLCGLDDTAATPAGESEPMN